MAGPIYNPAMPYLGPILGGVSIGKMIIIQGTVHPTAHRFAVNLQCGPNVNPRDDIALHINGRFDQSAIVRNSLFNQQWGPEESQGPFPLNRGQSFEFIILVDPDGFKIALNQLHLAEFRHRTPIERISYLAVDGDITLACIRYEGGHAPMGSTPNIGFVMPPSPAGAVSPSVPYPSSYPPPTTSYPPPHTSAYPTGLAPYPGGHSPYSAPPAYPQQAYPGVSPYSSYSALVRNCVNCVKGFCNIQHHSPHHSPRHSPKHGLGIGKSTAIPIVGGAAAGLLAGTVLHGGPKKAMKKQKKMMKKAMKHKHKYHHHGFHGYHGYRRHSSSSSSSSEEE